MIKRVEQFPYELRLQYLWFFKSKKEETRRGRLGGDMIEV